MIKGLCDTCTASAKTVLRFHTLILFFSLLCELVRYFLCSVQIISKGFMFESEF